MFRAAHCLSDGYGRPAASQMTGMESPSTIHSNALAKGDETRSDKGAHYR